MANPFGSTTTAPPKPKCAALDGEFGRPETDWIIRALRGDPSWPPTGIGSNHTARILAAAKLNRVQELLYAKLRESHLWSELPEALRHSLAGINRRATARELFLAAEFEQDLNALAAEGIQTLLLKGTALAYTLYPSPALRPRCDVDLLLRDKSTAHRRLGPAPTPWLQARSGRQR